MHLAAHHQRMPLHIWSQNGNSGSPCSSIFRRITPQASSHTQYHTISAEKHIISNLDRPALTNLSSRVRVVLRCKCVELTPASLCSSLAPYTYRICSAHPPIQLASATDSTARSSAAIDCRRIFVCSKVDQHLSVNRDREILQRVRHSWGQWSVLREACDTLRCTRRTE